MSSTERAGMELMAAFVVDANGSDTMSAMRKEKSSGDLTRSSSPELTLDAMRSATDLDEIADSEPLVFEKCFNEDKLRSSTTSPDISQFLTNSAGVKQSESDDEDDFVDLKSANFFAEEIPQYRRCAAFAAPGVPSEKIHNFPAGTTFDFRKYKAWVGANAIHLE
jgi:hypothetical protein